MTRALARAVAALAIAAPLLAGPACAQRRHRSGLWAEVASGPGFVRVVCTGCEEIAMAAGPGGFLRAGGTITQRAFLGLETFGFSDETFGFDPGDTSVVASTGTLAVVLLWFPWRSGVFFKGGVGAAGGDFIVTSTPTQADTAAGWGIAMTLGVGFDMPISRKFAITANAAAFIAAMGDVVLPTRTVDDVIATIYHAGIGITWR
jgi:hypothetical protein